MVRVEYGHAGLSPDLRDELSGVGPISPALRKGNWGGSARSETGSRVALDDGGSHPWDV
jgi:hypothetical protein